MHRFVQVSFGKDLEKSLNFYVDVRQACTNLDLVVNHVVVNMAGLGTQAHQLVKGKHNKRTTAFVKACMAACYVTIPTSENIITRLHLFLHCGQVSLVNGLITQAESFFKQCIQTIKDIPSTIEASASVPLSVEEAIAEFVADLARVMVCMPGHPENGPQYLVQALCSVVGKFPWNKLSTPHRAHSQMRLMELLCAYCQDTLPFRVLGVDGNDVLFPSPSEKAPCVDLLNKTLQEFLGDLGELKEAGVDDPVALALQASLMFELHQLLVTNALFTKGMATLVFNLFMGAHKSGELSRPKALKAVAAVRQMETDLERSIQPGLTLKIYRDVANKMAQTAGL